MKPLILAALLLAGCATKPAEPDEFTLTAEQKEQCRATSCYWMTREQLLQGLQKAYDMGKKDAKGSL